MTPFFKRSYVIAGVFVIAVALIGGGVILATRSSKSTSTVSGRSSDQPSNNASSTVRQSSLPSASGAAGGGGPQTATPTAIQSSPPRLGPPSIRLDGDGNGTTRRFNVAGGLTVFRWHCHCTGTFTAKLIDSNSSTRFVLSDPKGVIDGSSGKNVPAGAYTIAVQADSRWTIGVSQPRQQTGSALPRAYDGRGQSFVGPFTAGSSVHLTAKNTGEGNFVVQVLSANGETQDVAFNEIGNFQGSTVSNGLSGGPYYLNVESGGVWSIQVARS